MFSACRSCQEYTLTRPDKAYIKSAWEVFVQGDMSESGAVFFSQLFMLVPEAPKLFGFVLSNGQSFTVKDLLENEIFLSHAHKVWETVGSVVYNLNKLKHAKRVLRLLGTRHHSNGIGVEQFQHAGECLFFALEQRLGSLFTSHKTAWVKFYTIIESEMIGGLRSASKSGKLT